MPGGVNPRRGGDLAILCEILDNGPATMRELEQRVPRSAGAIHYAVMRLYGLGLVQYVGYAPRKPGAHHIPARLIGIGPRIKKGKE